MRWRQRVRRCEKSCLSSVWRLVLSSAFTVILRAKKNVFRNCSNTASLFIHVAMITMAPYGLNGKIMLVLPSNASNVARVGADTAYTPLSLCAGAIVSMWWSTKTDGLANVHSIMASRNSGRKFLLVVQINDLVWIWGSLCSTVVMMVDLP